MFQMNMTWGEVLELMRLVLTSKVFPSQIIQQAVTLYNQLIELGIRSTDSDIISAHKKYVRDITERGISNYGNMIRDYMFQLQAERNRGELIVRLPVEGVDFFPDYELDLEPKIPIITAGSTPITDLLAKFPSPNDVQNTKLLERRARERKYAESLQDLLGFFMRQF